MNTPLLSVLMLTYNHENFIRKSLESVVAQKVNFTFEVIIGEDCSTDNTRSIVREFELKYPDIIKPIYQEKNVGAARNAYEFCYPKLRGKYIACLEGDDYWSDPDKLQKQVDFLEKNNNCSLCFHKINVVDKDDKILEKGEGSSKIMLYKPNDIFHLKISILTIVYRNCFDLSKLLHLYICDYVLFGLLANYGGAADLGFVGGSYRKHSGGAYTGMSLLEQYRGTIKFLKKMQSYPVFSREQKNEIGKEISKRRKRYIKKFIKRNELLNSVKVALA